MRDEKHNPIQLEIAKAEFLLAQARLKEAEHQELLKGLEGAICISVAPGDGTTELTVYKPTEQSITLSNAELPTIIDSLIQREALTRHNR